MKARKDTMPKPGETYIVYDHIRTLYKIGFAGSAFARFAQLQTANAGIELVFAFKGTANDEYDLHERFAEKRVTGEWFALMPEDVEAIKSEFTPRNKPAGYEQGDFPGNCFKAPDPAHIARVMSRYRPGLRSSKMAESENERLHFDRLRETYGNAIITFTK